MSMKRKRTKPPTLTLKKIRELLARGAKDAAESEAYLAPTFTLTADNRSLVLR